MNNNSPIYQRANPAPANDYTPDISSLSMRDVTSVRDPEVERSYSPESSQRVLSSPRYTEAQQKQATNAIYRALDRWGIFGGAII